VVLHNPNENLIRDLERNSPTLDRIGDDFSRLLVKQTFTVWSFKEELPMPGVGKVSTICTWSRATSYLNLVDQVVVCGDSAIIGDARENRGTIRADHIGMVKFSARSDAGYIKVLDAIEMVLKEMLTTS